MQVDRIDRETYQALIKPTETIVVDKDLEVSPYHILHICGFAGVTNDLEIYKDIDFPIVNWAVNVESVNFVEGQDYFAGKFLLGGFDNSS